MNLRGDGALAPFADGARRDVEGTTAKCGAPRPSREDIARRQLPRPVDTEDVTAKLGALRLEDEFLPGTASLSDSSPSCNALGDSCPVTGRLSNIADDYVGGLTVLGKGHYGCVRECVHRRTQRTFACKSVRKSKNLSVEHLRNEVQILSEVNHRGVMKMVDCYEDAEYVHIVSERYTGGELFHVIVGNKHEGGCVSERYAARVARSLLEAVAYLHENDVVHRDIKPENILFESHEERTLKLIDFGLSRRHARRGPCAGVPAGTSYYMAPEVLAGAYDKSCDLWAVGVIAYMLLSGYPPFGGETDRDVFDAIERGSLRFPARQWDSKSDDAKEFVKYLLRRDPRTRMTAKEALGHPWVRNLGQRRERRRGAKAPSRIRYLKIP